MFEKKKVIYAGVCFTVIVLTLAFLVSAETSEITNALLKVSLHTGESADRVVSISSKEGGLFTLKLLSLQGVSVEHEQVTLNAGETRDITVRFDARTLKPGIYVGSLSVQSTTEHSAIPVIFEVESRDLLFDLNLDIPPQFKELALGDTLLSQVKLFDLTALGTNQGLGPSQVNLDIYIYDLEGRLITSQSETVVVDRQTQLTKTFSFPSTLSLGTYILSASATYGSSVGTASSLFSITEKQSSSFFSSSSASFLIIVLAIVAFFIIFFILLFVYFARDRNRLILELRAQQERESKELHRFLSEQERILRAKGARSETLRAEVNRKIRLLEQKHASREKEMKQLQKKGASQEMNKKLHEWKKKGYDTHLLEYKLKGLTNKEMSSLLADWKKKYHAEGYKK